MAGSRLPYTLQDDRNILRYIIDGRYETVLSGNAVWKQMEDDNVCPGRSWQSLKNRFKRNVKSDFARPEFGLTLFEKKLLKSSLYRPLDELQDSPPVKRNVDVRLIARRLEKQVKVEVASKENKAISSEELKTEALEKDETNEPVNEPKEKPRKLLSLKKKNFSSLDVEWSDSDSDSC